MNIIQLIKGIIVGIAKIIPGFSGAVLLISFNLYDKAIDAITNFFREPKKNFLFLFNLGLGIILGIVLFSKIIHYFIVNYYLYTISLFVGLIIGGIPILWKEIIIKKKNILLIIGSFILILGISLLGDNGDYVIKNNYIDYIMFFIAGILEAVGTILPGISSTALLMLMGLYNHYLVILSGSLNVFYLSDTLRFIIPFSLGMIIGIIGLSILINYLFRHYKSYTYSIILGISISSIVILSMNIFSNIISISYLFISLLMLSLGYLITRSLK